MALARQTIRSARFAANSTYRRPRSDRFRTAGEPCRLDCPTFQLTGWTEAVGRCVEGRTIGLVDTGIDVTHPSLRGAAIEIATVRRTDRSSSAKEHGTAVASLIVGQRASEVVGVAPGARLLAVDAFHRDGGSDTADTFDLISALRLLGGRNIGVINMSLTGPDNPFLEEVVADLVDKGGVIVAAVGEPGRQQGYPARYAGVIAVGSVDGRLRASRRNARGEHLAFSAPGVGLVAAAPNGRTARVTGSSFAAPIVTAVYAADTRGRPRDELTRLIPSGAQDLGERGKDAIYGWGLIQFTPLSGC